MVSCQVPQVRENDPDYIPKERTTERPIRAPAVAAVAAAAAAVTAASVPYPGEGRKERKKHKLFKRKARKYSD